MKVTFRKDFELNFKGLFDEASQRMTEPQHNDMAFFYEEKELFNERLFEVNSDSLKQYNEIHKAFEQRLAPHSPSKSLI